MSELEQHSSRLEKFEIHLGNLNAMWLNCYRMGVSLECVGKSQTSEPEWQS